MKSLEYLGKIGSAISSAYSSIVRLADDTLQLERWRAMYGDDLENRVVNYGVVVAENDRLLRDNEGLTGRYEELVSRNDELVLYNERLKSQVDEVKRAQEKLALSIQECKVTHDEMVDVAFSRSEANQGLETFRNYESVARKRAERELDLLRSSAYAIAVDVTLNLLPKMQKVPFVYYDMHNQRTISTRATLDLMGIEEEPDNISKKGILSYVREQDRRSVIIGLMGNELKHHKVMTEKGDELVLTSHSYNYGKQRMGIGIFLHNPRLSLETGGIAIFTKRLGKIVHRVEEKLSEAARNVIEGIEKPVSYEF